MRFAKISFWIASGWGMLVLIPMYFMLDTVGRKDPPPITHPDFYFGFLGVALAWQVAFFILASDPVRYRPMMIPSIIEKVSYVGAIGVLYAQGRIHLSQAIPGIPDSILAVLFVVSYVMTKHCVQERS